MNIALTLNVNDTLQHEAVITSCFGLRKRVYRAIWNEDAMAYKWFQFWGKQIEEPDLDIRQALAKALCSRILKSPMKAVVPNVLR